MPVQTAESSGGADPDLRPTIWGLGAQELHDAWWRGRGVQCVHRGSSFERIRGAELYMLLERDQLVAFDLREIAEAMVWAHAEITRIRIIKRSEEAYKEQLVRSADGEVTGLRRSYSHDESTGFSIALTRSADAAKRWAESGSRRSGWLEMRRFGEERIDYDRVYGRFYDNKLEEERAAFVRRLVASWQDPDRVIEGLVSPVDGIFCSKDHQSLPDVCVAPAWIGVESESLDRPVIGPDFIEDGTGTPPEALAGHERRSIHEIPLPNGRRTRRLLPRGSLYGILKRGFDVTAAAGVLLFLSPVFLVVAIAVAVDDGRPIFFGHTRQKRGGANFKCWKFRTMRRDAESMVASLSQMNKADGPQVFIEDDPRVTRIGRLLRKFQLDELPQFWNVLTGDMSVVGPRPSPDRENQYSPAWREIRLSVRPGITGLWQVERTRRPGEDFQEWIKYDIEYVRSASFGFDLLICLRTARNLLMRGG